MKREYLQPPWNTQLRQRTLVPNRVLAFICGIMRHYKEKLRFLSFCSCRRCWEEDGSEEFHDAAGTMSDPTEWFENPRIFSYTELYIGSNGFSDAEVIGIGGFGKVYRTVLPSDGTVVAVKCCLAERGYKFEKTFAAELVAVANLRHRNLVRLRGWCVQDDRLLLVYDYMPNRSLDRVLFYKRAQHSLVWERRKRILSGLASALHYLHQQLETQIIHRDVKTSNVMLDSNYSARLGDFGLARWLEHNLNPTGSLSSMQSQFRLSDTSRIGGTIGYLSPESFHNCNSITVKSDVFSFGVVVLEVVSGRRTLELSFSEECMILLDYTRMLADENRTLKVKDERLVEGLYALDEMQRVIHIGLLCTLHNPDSRPDMKWVIEALSGSIAGELPPLPCFKTHPLYIALSSPDINSATTPTSLAYDSSTYLTALGETVYLSAENEEEIESISKKSRTTTTLVETPREISYQEIISSTHSFSESKRVSEFDFGTAYHGMIGNKDRVLIKRLGMKTCPALRARFSSELRNLSRLRHRNLVQLRGWCMEQGEMLVVYDYLENQFLAHLLFNRNNPHILQWHQRYNILKSLASVIAYLHEGWEEQVIHRNITSSAIILDRNLNPKLSSFALAQFLTRNEHDGGDHQATNGCYSVRGIFGYMPPEYLESGKASPQADVYSFGVLILELITGQAAVDFRRPEVLLAYRIRCLLQQKGRQPEQLIDTRLDGSYVYREFIRLVKLAIACTSTHSERRPAIKEIVKILDGDDDSFMKQEFVERMDEWKQRNACSLSLIRRIQTLGIH